MINKETTMNSLLPFEWPCSVAVVGPTMSGKTYLTAKLLRSAKHLFTKTPVAILYAYGIHQDFFYTLEKEIPELKFHEGIPEKSTLDELAATGPAIVVLDDLMEELGRSKEMCNLMTRGVHHLGLSTIVLNQNLYQKSPFSRTISLNLSYFILLKTCRDLSQISYLSRQMFPQSPKRLAEAYEDAVCREHRGYLVVSMHPNTQEDARLATKIFPDEYLILYCKK